MALRVLLADESSTIKKVFQLALQDFAVEVRPVNIGVDVLLVAKNFQPDIIFADVLLQKKNGYEVSAELKTEGTLANIPVVLMWSGFMELDEDKFQASHANGRLEKPFDVTALRKLVADLVPKTQSQRMSQFLSFPKMPEMQEPAPQTAAPKSEEDFQQVSIAKRKVEAPPPPPRAPTATAAAPAAPKSPDRFRIPVESEDDPHMTGSLKMSNDAIDVESIFRNADDAEEFRVKEKRTGAPAPVAEPIPVFAAAPIPEPAPRAAVTLPTLNEEDIERIVREQAQQMIEAVVWKVLPELAQQIIEREIQKLLKEKDASHYR
jgi:CheY-like chemotaxis protein